ncbi:MAG: box helicase domain protein, partial [Polaromonas sp.]|nr:box helicase domain protein [Polaromonas sp.]
ASTIPGLEPQQRFAPTSERPRGNFGGGRDDRGGGRSFGGGGDRGGFAGRKPASGGFGGGNAGSFGGGNSGGGFGGNRDDRGGSFQGRPPAPQGNSYADRSGFNDRNARRPDDRGFGGGNSNAGFAPREDRGFGGGNEGFAPRADFENRKPAFAKPAGKVFVPRDAAKKPGKFSKPFRD